MISVFGRAWTGVAGALRPRPPVFLDLNNRRGSVEHYYHFLLGFLAPLMLAHERLNRTLYRPRIHVRSCAVMDPHLASLALPGLVILDKENHRQGVLPACRRPVLRRAVSRSGQTGFDHPGHYDFACLGRARQLIRDRLSQPIAEAERQLAAQLARRREGAPFVVLIGRQPPDPFYLSVQSEKKAAGSQRRSIRNFQALASAVTANASNALVVMLENKSLAFQIALFSQADVILAQHGAALANLLWARPGAAVVEIIPQDMRDMRTARAHFSRLAEGLGMRYHWLAQASRHSEVDIEAVIGALKQASGAEAVRDALTRAQVLQTGSRPIRAG